LGKLAKAQALRLSERIELQWARPPSKSLSNRNDGMRSCSCIGVTFAFDGSLVSERLGDAARFHKRRFSHMWIFAVLVVT
jgi:hypothetical protein